MFPPGTRGRARGLPYTMDAFMLGMGMLGESPRAQWEGKTVDAYSPTWATHPVGRLPPQPQFTT